MQQPKKYHKSYDDKNQANIIKIINWLNDNNYSQAYLSRLTRLPNGTISVLLNGSYSSTPDKQIATIIQAITNATEKTNKGGFDFVQTSVYELAESICNRARLYGDFGLLSGFVGIGKTFSLKHYQSTHSNTLLIEVDPDFTKTALLNDLMAMTNAVSIRKKPSVSDKFRAVVEALKGSDTLLIIDEAETMQPSTLHYLRRIRDKAGIGIVLSGTEHLHQLIKPHHGQFDQVRSRTPFIPATIKSISTNDAKALINVGLDTADDAIINRLWTYCQGSARVLTEGLIPAIKDFGLAKGHQLNTQLIDSVAVKALGLKQIKQG